MKKRRFVIGDIHGANKALLQVFERSGFNYENDELISLGDVVDGWPETAECIDTLLKIKNLVHVAGNHDDWALSYYENTMKMGEFRAWFSQGGESTIKSLGDHDQVKNKHIQYLKKAKLYYVMDGDKIFAHGGVPSKSFILEKAEKHQFTWDRSLIQRASEKRNKKTVDDRWEEIYVGHTPVVNFKIESLMPQKWTNLWAMDTSACYKGVVSMMDIDTKEVFQSDECHKIYPDHKGRNNKSYNDEK